MELFNLLLKLIHVSRENGSTKIKQEYPRTQNNIIPNFIFHVCFSCFKKTAEGVM